jgi:microcystin-dependent protein
MSNSQIGPSVPVGSVITFAGNETALQTLEGWFPCDGRELDRIAHEELFHAIGYANGGNGSTTFKLPDYRGYFLRGVDQGTNRDPDADDRYPPKNVGNSGDNPGSLQHFATAMPSQPFTLTVPHLPVRSKNVYDSEGPRMARWTSGSTQIAFTGGSNETRPLNNYVYFIIKRAQKNAAGTDVTIPVGAVVPIAGTGIAGLGNQWLLCNGSVLNRTQYKQLSQAIGIIHGGDETNFYLPDYRGYFLRGVSGDSLNDPDAADRLPPQPTLPPGQQGAFGNNVGSVQLNATAQANNKFTVQLAHLPTSWVKVTDNVSGSTNSRWTGVSQLTAPTSGGGNESRPINAYVDWYIKTFDASPL